MIEQAKRGARAGAWALVATLVAGAALGVAAGPASPERQFGRRPFSVAASSDGGASVASTGNGFAAASSGRGSAMAGRGFSAASDGFSPARRPARRAPSVDEAKRQRQLKEMEQMLSTLEAGPVESLDKCKEWEELSQRYSKLRGADRRVRQHEQYMKEHCDYLADVSQDVTHHVEFLRELFADRDSDQLQYVSALASLAVDLQKRFRDDPVFEREFGHQLHADPSLSETMRVFESFMGHMAQTLAESDYMSASEPRSDFRSEDEREVDSLDKSIRQLVNYEHLLDSDDLLELSSRATQLAHVVSDPGQVKPGSARQFYLTGTLNAANAVLARQLVEEPAYAELHQQAQPEDLEYERRHEPEPELVAPVHGLEHEYEHAAEGGYDHSNEGTGVGGEQKFDDHMSEAELREMMDRKYTPRHSTPERPAMAAEKPASFEMPTISAPAPAESSPPTPAPVPAEHQPEQVPAPAAPAVAATAAAAPEQSQPAPAPAPAEPATAGQSGQPDAKPSAFMQPSELMDALRRRRFAAQV